MPSPDAARQLGLRAFAGLSAAAEGKMSLDSGSTAISQLDRPQATPARWLMQNLIILGDPFHPPGIYAPSLTAIMAGIGMESDVEEDADAGCRKLASDKYGLLKFSAARWRMLNATSGPVESLARQF